MKNNKAAKIILVQLITLILVPTILVIKPTFAQTATLKIIPPSIVDPTIDIGSKFIINATVNGVVNLWNWQVKVLFDPTVIACARAWIPSDSPFNFPIKPAPIIDNVTGFVMLGASRLGGDPGVSGDGVLASFEFQVMKRGSSYINYSRPYGEDTYLLDPDMSEIPATMEDGYFSNWVPPPPAILYINPPRVVDPTLTPCNEFNLNVSIINATDLYSWQLSVWFPRNLLNATNVVEGPFLKSGGSTHFEYSIISTVNETYDAIVMSCTITSGVGVSGNGDLAIITFHVEDLGESSIPIFDDILRDSIGNALSHDTFNGYFSNILLAKLSIDPPEVRDPSLVPGTSFTINVTIADIENMKKVIFNLTYTREVLLELQVTIPSVQGQMPSKKMVIDDDSGYIWVNLTYPNPITTYTPVTIATIIFHVEAWGVSPINLTDTYIEDSLGKPIVHEVQHGYFASLIRDVAVTAIDTARTWVYQGWLAYINVTVTNKGNVTESFDVKAFYESTLIGIINVADLLPSESRTIIFVWNTTPVTPCNEYEISAEAVQVPYETNLADNVLTDGTIKVRYMGDINGDGKVDMIDIGLVSLAFGSNPLHPRWNPDADLKQDNKIDMLDIGLIARNYGKGCS